MRDSAVSDTGNTCDDGVPVFMSMACWSCAMPREIRDRTVPSGTSRISAISLYECCAAIRFLINTLTLGTVFQREVRRSTDNANAKLALRWQPGEILWA